MFKCAICGKEYSDKDMNEMRLLNRQKGDQETFHVCATCLDNKEDMVAYLAEKKSMSTVEARHLYDYFVPLLDGIESPLLGKYIEVRLRSLRSKLADNIKEPDKAEAVKSPVKKKASVFKRLKTALVAMDGVLSVCVLVVMAIMAAINPVIMAPSIVMGIVMGISIFVAGYFAIDSYVRMREDSYRAMKKGLGIEDDEEKTESEETPEESLTNEE